MNQPERGRKAILSAATVRRMKVGEISKDHIIWKHHVCKSTIRCLLHSNTVWKVYQKEAFPIFSSEAKALGVCQMPQNQAFTMAIPVP